jgi:CspA family cold shock protein
MVTATVKFFNADRGFGFLAPGDGQRDVFVHATGLASAGRLVEGQKVSYELGTDSRIGKPCATNVRIV